MSNAIQSDVRELNMEDAPKTHARNSDELDALTIDDLDKVTGSGSGSRGSGSGAGRGPAFGPIGNQVEIVVYDYRGLPGGGVKFK